jgi:TPP-dependent pyruvate/acetoin dehydrogenase alpha subunit
MSRSTTDVANSAESDNHTDSGTQHQKAMSMYRQMQLMRRFEETVLELREVDVTEIQGPVHPYVGQEAVAAGICGALKREDKIISTHRGHGHCIGKGARTDRMMAELFGKRTGYCKGKGGSMHIADFDIGMLGANGIVAAGMPIATGAALAESMAGSTNVVVCMFGDGAAAAGPLHETMNIAALWNLPLIFVCENNGWSVNTQPNISLAAKTAADLAAPFGIPSKVVDGNDVNEMLAASEWAVDRARRGEGPSMLEAKTFRGLGHAYRGSVTPDGRDPQLLAEWGSRDPIELFARFILENGLGSEPDLQAARLSVNDELVQAVQFARDSPFPELFEALEDVFA